MIRAARFAALMAWVPRLLWAHAITADPLSGGAGIAARYADGSPAAFVEVTVYAPGEDRVFQQGSTDREGRFVFFPFTAGSWRIRVDDGMGHALETTLEASPAMHTPPAPPPPARPLFWPVVTGVAVIWGLFGTWFMVRRRV
ncbi:MAG: hypothetical protein NZ740_09305 [Kiritimatiellae bacterium]|nr:hypothetical protein [Kiritimatiellia bacterium]MDW8459290.1 hypothetical protein [Verrucomicrobiota bacterium]